MDEKLEYKRHTLAHLLAAAVKEIRPDAKPAIGPAVENGFYYDFDFGDTPISESDLPKLKKHMLKLLQKWNSSERHEVTKEEALREFADNEYKKELIEELAAGGEQISIYESGGFRDLCRGGHSENPAKAIIPDSFKLDRIAGAYWKGDENNKMLTRIYGLAFDTKNELEAYEKQLEEAKKRDHRKLARELDLLVFSDLVGSGMPLWTPRGNVVRNEVVNYSRELNRRLGFDEVHSPNVNKAELFKVSGHYDQYKEDMLTVSSQYVKDEMFLKPMNCPQHTQIYASRPRSYRDLPVRYSDFANLYRDERPGELSGLTRLRSFAQDDGHVFCREDQIEEEIEKILGAIEEALQTYGVGYWMRLSLRDSEKKEKYLGDDAVWERSQNILQGLLEKKKIKHKAEEGEAAFYGPKIDIVVVDAIGREWQMSTIQLDFSMPSRFDLTYVDKDGSEKTPVMIHRALVGSPDRFLGVLIEHYAGAFPLWLSPVHIAVLPISENHVAYAREIQEALHSENIRVTLDESNETLGKKIRNAKTEKVPYLAVIGDKEVENKNITIESRDGNSESMTIEKLTEKLQSEIKSRKS